MFPKDELTATVVEQAIMESSAHEPANPAHAEIRAWKAGQLVGLTRRISQALVNRGRLAPVAPQ
jgi:hypothetical protein